MLGFRSYNLDMGPKWVKAWKMGQGRDERTYIWTDGRTDGWTDGRTDSPCVLQDFVPFGATALKRPMLKSFGLYMKILSNVEMQLQVSFTILEHSSTHSSNTLSCH